MMKKIRHKGEQHLRYNQKVCKKKDTFDILNDISENITLVPLVDTLGNVNHDISIVCYWIFDFNYEKELRLTRESLDLMCSPSVGEEQVVKFENMFFAVIYMWAPGNPKIV